MSGLLLIVLRQEFESNSVYTRNPLGQSAGGQKYLIANNGAHSESSIKETRTYMAAQQTGSAGHCDYTVANGTHGIVSPRCDYCWPYSEGSDESVLICRQ
jgi:hypothetical protein